MFRKMMLILMVTMMAFGAATVMAQDAPTLSTGCQAAGGSTFSGDFLAGEVITVTVVGSAFELLSDGSPTVPSTTGADGETASYEITAAGTYNFDVALTTSGASVTVSCDLPTDDVTIDGKTTICHFPPGNPAAAHTITVGPKAAENHIERHGDTIGACPEELESRADDYEDGIFIFVLAAGDSNSVEFWGNCEGDECELVIDVDFDEIDLSAIDGFQLVLDGDDDDGYELIVFFLHEYDFDDDDFDINDGSDDDDDENMDGTDGGDTEYVFQLNLYFNGVLINDNILLFLNSEGDIVRWTSQNFWNELLEDD